MTEKSFSQHQSEASKARWAKKTPEERSAYARKMVEAREAKRETKRISECVGHETLDYDGDRELFQDCPLCKAAGEHFRNSPVENRS